MLTRRIFLRGSAIVMAGTGPAPVWLKRATAAVQGRRKILIAIFQRGAADGLNIVPPFGDKRYYELRPTLAVPAPAGSGSPGFAPGGPTIDLDGRFGLHPALQPLKALWDQRMMAIVVATGSPDPSRSHFEAQEYMESGTPGMKRDGWLNRALPPARPDDPPLRAIAAGPTLPRTLQGDNPAIAVANGGARFRGAPVLGQRVIGIAATATSSVGVPGMTMDAGPQFHISEENAAIVESMYVNSGDAQVGTAGRNAFAAMRTLESLTRTPYNPSGGAQYGGGGELGRSLQQIARLIKADVGVEAAFAEIGGWDHHQNEPAQLSNVLRQLGAALAAFCKDMGDRMEDIVLITMSEFGRTAQENGNNGTDHGHGNVMLALGGAVNGGRIYGKWPGLEREQLYEGRDLAVTTDFRTVLSELAARQLGIADVARVFPGYRPAEPLNLLR